MPLRLDPSTFRAAPTRALAHPWFLLPLAALALNDHVLKGSGLLPGLVTGKLSDFAGLLVAPVLLAALLGLRGRRAWLAVHLAIGGVFAAIQLWTGAASLWSGLMAAVAMPWVITSDPTDLIALAMLPISFAVFPRLVRRRVRSNLRRSAELAAAGTGLVCCIATSGPTDNRDDPGPIPPPADTGVDDGAGDGDGVFWDDIQAAVYLHNATGGDLVVRVRKLSSSAVFDCDVLALDPGRLLGEGLFDLTQSWTMPPTTNLGFSPVARSCQGLWVEADGLPPTIVFWRDGAPAVHTVPGAGTGYENGLIEIGGSLEALSLNDHGQGLAFTPVVQPEPTGACTPQLAADRLGWSEPLPLGAQLIDSVDVGLDGCLGLELRDQASEAAPQRWYLCVPQAAFPFAVGEELVVKQHDTGITVSDPFGATGHEMAVLAGRTWTSWGEVELAVLPVVECDFASLEPCSTVARPAEIRVSSLMFGTGEFRADGEVHMMAGESGAQLGVFVARAEERAAFERHCAGGSDLPGPDMELVLTAFGAGQ